MNMKREGQNPVGMAATTAFLRHTALGMVLALAMSAWSTGSSGAPANEPVQLQVSGYIWLEPGRGENVWKVIENCAKEQPNLSVKQMAVPFSKYGDVILQQLAAGAGPDVMQLRINQFAAAARAGLLANLDGLVNKDAISGLTLVNESGVVDGKRYGYIQEVTNFGLFYNVSMLSKAGIKPPTTFDELLAAAKQLTNAGAGQYGLASRGTMAELDGWQSDLSYYVFGFGASWTDTKGYPSFDTPEMRNAVDAYLKVVKAGVMPSGTDSPTFRRMFAEGKVAMLLQNQNVPVTIVKMNGAMKGNIKAVVSPFPSGKQPMIESLFAISNSSRKKGAAGKLMQCLLTPDNQQRLAVAYEGGTPATDVYSRPGPALQNLLASAPWLGEVEKNSVANAIPIVPRGAEHLVAKYQTIFFNELSRIQAGEETVAEGLSRAQKLAMDVARKDAIVGKR